MKLEIELWHLILLLLSFFGAFGTGAKLLLDAVLKHQDFRADAQDKASEEFRRAFVERLDRIDSSNKEETQHWLRVERELNKLQIDLPNMYVRREDYIRGQSVLEARYDGLMTKIEGLGDKLENAQLRAMHHAQVTA